MNYDLYKNRCRFLLDDKITTIKKYELLNQFPYFSDILSYDDFKKCKNFDSSRSQKRKRCFDKYKIIDIYSCLTKAKMVFGTITLNDDFLKSS